MLVKSGKVVKGNVMEVGKLRLYGTMSREEKRGGSWQWELLEDKPRVLNEKLTTLELNQWAMGAMKGFRGR